MITPLDSKIFGPLFGDAETNELLSEEAYVRALVEVEAALAKAQAQLGIIPSSAGEQISRVDSKTLDIGALTKGTMRSGFPIIALVQELRKQVDSSAAPYVHWGATTQDIMDTACVLQIRSVIKLFRDRLADVLATTEQ